MAFARADGLFSESTGKRARRCLAAGSTVFFDVQAGGCLEGASGPAAAQAYARIGSPGASQTTINLAGSSPSACEASSSYGLSEAVT